MIPLLAPLGALLLSYLVGSLPFSLWITHWVTGKDVRAGGSGNAGATNVMRQAGWLAAALVLVLDLGKGWLPTALALAWDLPEWTLLMIAALTVIGHCWPVWAHFQGGMGLATAAGALFALSPLGLAVGLGLLIALVLSLRHSARGAVVAGVLYPPLLWALGFHGPILWTALSVGAVLVVRFSGDWNRVYKELWLDRDR
jgi:glycerol-3-phosphate acyltransferase PlsY